MTEEEYIEEYQTNVPDASEEIPETETYDDEDNEEDGMVEDVAPADMPPPEKQIVIMNKTREGHNIIKGRLGKLVGKHGERRMVAYQTKEKLLAIINENMDDYRAVLDVMKQEDPRAFVAAMTTLTKYIAPTLASVTAEVNAEARITIEDTLKSLSVSK